MNVERLQRVKARVLAEPERFEMSDYTTPVINDGCICDTACCIGGHAALDAGYIRLRSTPREGYAVYYDVTPSAPGYFFDTRSLFDAALDLQAAEADRLFIVSHWPAKYRDAYEGSTDYAERAQVAAKRIDHFIRTRGRE